MHEKREIVRIRKQNKKKKEYLFMVGALLKK